MYGNVQTMPNIVLSARSQLTQEIPVLMMNQWISLGNPVGNFWVIDSDGWAYWAAPLMPGQATSNLLNSIDVHQPGGQWFYGIHIIGQFAAIVEAEDEEILPLIPEVGINKSVYTFSVLAGSIVTYTITVQNAGDVVLNNLEVGDQLPSTVINPSNLVLPSGATGAFDGQNLTVKIPSLAVGATAIITFDATIAEGTAPGNIDNTAKVTVSEYDLEEDDTTRIIVTTTPDPTHPSVPGEPTTSLTPEIIPDHTTPYEPEPTTTLTLETIQDHMTPYKPEPTTTLTPEIMPGSTMPQTGVSDMTPRLIVLFGINLAIAAGALYFVKRVKAKGYEINKASQET